MELEKLGVEAADGRGYTLNIADVPFDTLVVTRHLESKGFGFDQAEAISYAVRAGVTGGVATKADTAELRMEIAELRADIAELRTDLRWIKVIGAGIASLLIAAFGFVVNMLTE